jgi:hypothetical protein
LKSKGFELFWRRCCPLPGRRGNGAFATIEVIDDDLGSANGMNAQARLRATGGPARFSMLRKLWASAITTILRRLPPRLPASAAGRPGRRAVYGVLHDCAFAGIIATTVLNADYPSHEAYLDAIAREMAYEYRAMVDAGLYSRSTRPIWQCARTSSGRSSAHWRRRPSGRCCSIRSGPTCREPWVKGLTIITNSIYNEWRMEDVWLDK